MLHHLVGLTGARVASTLDISPGTAKTHMRRRMAALRKSAVPNLKEEHLARFA